MEIKEIIKLLEYNNGFFPRGPLKQAILNRVQITPELLRIIEYSTTNAKELLEDSYWGHIFAFFLLAQFREKFAYPLIVSFFSIPGELSLDLTGDVVTETLSRILASVSGGDSSLMCELVENDAINEYVRDAALEGLLCLVASGDKTREEILSYYQSLFRGKLTRKPSQVWNGLVAYSERLYPEEIYEDIKQAFEDNLIDPQFIDIKNIDEQLALGKEETLSRLFNSKPNYYGFIDDTIAELEGWYCFKYDGKISRNESCLCGSGIKYKKCCYK